MNKKQDHKADMAPAVTCIVIYVCFSMKYWLVGQPEFKIT